MNQIVEYARPRRLALTRFVLSVLITEALTLLREPMQAKLLTAYGTMQDAVDTMKLRAYDFMIKSVDLNGIDWVMTRALDVLRLRQQLADRTYDLSMWGLAKT